MNAQTQIVPPTDGELALFQSYTPLAVLTDEKVYSEFYQKLRDLVDAQEPDVSTLKGRNAIASLAAKVARTKTAIDNAGKKLNEEARAQINAVDASRRTIREQLDELKVEARKPLTEWEEAEAKREADAKAELDSIRAMGRVEFLDNAEDVQSRLATLQAMEISADLHGVGIAAVSAALAEAIDSLTTAHDRMVREEQERAELAKLRAAQAEREAADAAKREEEQRAEGKRQYARSVIEHIHQCGLGMIGGQTYPYIIIIRELEEKVVATEEEFGDMAGEVEKARRETLDVVLAAQKKQAERAEREAAERAANEARQKAEQEAQEKAAAKDRAHAEALAAASRRAEEAERTAQAERDRIAKEEADRKAAAEREAAEQAAREKNRAHRGKIMAAAKEAIMEAGPVEEPIARAIVLAIAAGSVPAVSIHW